MLYISPEPLNADDIVEALEVARSKDVWDMFRIVMDERKKREFDPTRHMLRACRAEAEKDKATDEYTEARLKELYGFFETTTNLYAQVRRWTPAAIMKFMKAGDRVLKALRWVRYGAPSRAR